jgi:hypothetical protein
MTIKNRLRLLLLAALPLPVLAQDVADATEETAEPEIRRYTVELIVFRYAEDVAWGSEVFLPDEPEEELLEPLEEALPEVGEVTVEPGEEPEPLPDSELVLLEEEDYQLTSAWEQLELLDAYEPLMHFGWTQAAWPQEQTEAIPLALFAVPPEDLDGTLMLYLSRYLHLVVDLQLRAPDAAIDEAPEPQRAYGYNGSGTDFGYEEQEQGLPQPVYYRIQENRILRNGELRYYDHPKFGVLARVSRFEEADEPEDGELLGYPLQ